VRYIKPEDFKIFDQEKILDDKVKEAERLWLEEVKKAHQGLIKYDDTAPLFNKYLEAHNEWKQYFDQNVEILLAQRK